MSNLLSNFPERLRQLRTAKALTQSELADALGVSRNSIFFYESAQRTPDIIVLKKIADYFGVTCDYMIGASINRSEETRDIGDELGLTDESISALKNSIEKAKSDLKSQVYLICVNKIICNKKLVADIATYIAKAMPDNLNETERAFLCTRFDIENTSDNYEKLSALLESLFDAQIMRQIQSELEQMRGDNSTNADQEN